MKGNLAVCQKCKGTITRRSTDLLCGKCYLQKRKDARAKKTEKTVKKNNNDGKFWF